MLDFCFLLLEPYETWYDLPPENWYRKVGKNQNGKSLIVGGTKNGGTPVAMSMNEVLLKNSEVDIACTGEGEITIVELLDRLEKDLNAQLDDIAGICYTKGNNGETVLSQKLVVDKQAISVNPSFIKKLFKNEGGFLKSLKMKLKKQK